MTTDTLQLTAPAAQKELDLLRTLRVGDMRQDVFMGALPVGLEWVCVQAEKDRWVLEGRFCDQPLMEAIIVQTETALVLRAK